MTTASVIGVVGGSGGTGASVFTCAIAARAAASGRTVVCVDGDRLGGGLDVTLGLEQEPGLRWPDLAGARGRLDGAELIGRLPAVDDVSVLSFDRYRDVDLAAASITHVLRALTESSDVVVVDLPRTDHPSFHAFAHGVAHLVLLAGRGVRELAGAAAVAALSSVSCPDLWLCVRSAGRDTALAEAVAAALDLPLLGLVRDDPQLDADLRHGLVPGARARGCLAAAADRVLAQMLPSTRAGALR